MFSKLAVAALVTSGASYFYFGLSKPITTQERVIQEKIFVHKEIRGDYWAFAPQLDELSNDFSGIPSNTVRLGAIYYDNPHSVIDRSQGRVAVGGFFEPDQLELAEKFAKSHPEYDLNFTKSFDSITTVAPYANYFSFLISRLRKVRSRAYRYGFTKSLLDANSLPGLIELYPFLNGGEKEIQIMIPYGSGAKQFKSKTLPAPDMIPESLYPYIIGDFKFIFHR